MLSDEKHQRSDFFLLIIFHQLACPFLRKFTHRVIYAQKDMKMNGRVQRLVMACYLVL